MLSNIWNSLLLVMILTVAAQAQEPRKYAFKEKKDTTMYKEGQTFYYLDNIYRQWNGSRFMYGFHDGKEEKKHITEAVYDTIAYRYLHRKSMGFYRVRKDGKWGLLKEDRSIWVPIQYDKLNYNTHVKNYYISIQNGNKYGILDENGGVILDAIYEDILYDGHFYKVIKDDKMGIIGPDGEELIPVCFHNILHDKRFEAQQVQKEKGGKWAVFNWIKDNPCQPKMQYDQIEPILEFFVVRDDKKYGLMDVNGKELLPFEYDYMSPFFSKFLSTVLVGKDGKVGLMKVDSTGKTSVKVPIEYHDIWVEQGTNKLKVKLNDKIDYYFNDQTLFDLEYNDVKYQQRIDKCMVKKGNKWGMVSVEGELIIPIAYDRIHIMDKYQFLVEKKGKWGVVSNAGKEIIKPIYDEFDFRPKMNAFFVKKNGLWGIISLRGGVILPPKYQNMYALPNKKFLVQQKDQWGIVGAGGYVVVPIQYASYKYKYKDNEVLLIDSKGAFKKYRIMR